MRTLAFSTQAGIAAGSALFLLLLAGCSDSDDPFTYVKVSGTVTYEDGSVIPAKDMMLWFFSETPPVGNRHPRPGMVRVDVKTGRFGCPSTHYPFNGLVLGMHKVIVTASADHAPLPADLVPPEYNNPKKTPLEVSTDGSPFHIKVRRPTNN